MAIGQALLIKPPRAKVALQQQGQEIQQVNKASVLQEQSLKFEQSLELVQTLLGASVSSTSTFGIYRATNKLYYLDWLPIISSVRHTKTVSTPPTLPKS